MSEGSPRNKLISYLIFFVQLMKELPVNQILCNFDTLIEVCFYKTTSLLCLYFDEFIE